MDRSWMRAERYSDEYINGVNEFVSFAVRNAKDKRFITCPCWKCMNIRQCNEEKLKEHLVVNGFVKGYTRWTNHGESTVEVEGLNNTTHMDCGDDDENMYNNTFEDNVRDHPEMFEAGLGSDVNKPLYPGCSKFSKLSAVLTFWNLKAAHQLSNVCFDELLSVVSDMFPDENVLPRSTYEAKKLLNSIGLTHERIHACREDCILYRGEYADLQECPMCNAPRYNNNKSAAKVMWYFPIIPRLRRLYSSAEVAKLLTWHDDGRIKDGMLRHPADSPQWKTIDAMHPQFGEEHRNLRIALSSDGMNPFGMQSTSHSTWPVVLMIYNLPPWLCFKRKYMMLSILIAGPKQPGNNIDVYLTPLIEDLRVLWEDGVNVYDGHKKENFTLRAMIFGTINDFPAYGNLSGYTTKGKLACPICEENTDHIRLKHCRKEVFMGHRKWLPIQHRYRNMKKAFNGKKEEGVAPRPLTGVQVYEKVKHLETKFGKTFAKDVSTQGWKKLSIFFQLPYWKDLPVRHFIDLMHVQKNAFEAVLNTLLGVNDKSKDHLNARKDLVAMKLRPELAPKHIEGKKEPYLPPAAHTLSKVEKRILCETLQSVKVPSGYSSNISSLISLKDTKLKNLKSHDCHVIMCNLLPIAIRSILPEKVRAAITKLCMFFKAISSKVIDPKKLAIKEKQLVETICELEMYFPPSFFDVMIHLIIHLTRETRLCGNARMRWMYPMERYMKVLKGYVNNRYRPEGCIAERYLVEEGIEFWSEYIPNVEAIGLPRSSRDENFEGEGLTGKKHVNIGSKQMDQAHLCVLHNTADVERYVDLHKMEIRSGNPKKIATWISKEHNRTFIEWFKGHIDRQLQEDSNSITDEIKWLARGPCAYVFSYQSYTINGYTFCTKEHDSKRTTQNSGVSLIAQGLHMSSVKDKNPIWGNMQYFGVIEHILELDYVTFQVPVFECIWANNNNGLQFDDLGFTRVDINRAQHTDESFILASHAKQVFYVTDPLDNNWSIVLLSNKMNNFDETTENVDDDYVEDDPFMGIQINNDGEEDGCYYVREDHNEGEWVTTNSHVIQEGSKKRKTPDHH